MPSAESLATSEVSNGSGYGTRSVPATLSSNIGTQLVVLVEQTSGHEVVLKRATSIMEADMRWRPLLSIRWKRSSRRLFIAMAGQRKNLIDAN